MSREDLLENCVCPVCEDAFACFQDLYDHLYDHCEEDISIAEDFLEECARLAAREEFEDEDCLD